jgi:ribosome-associated heat shock protein Hsp15
MVIFFFNEEIKTMTEEERVRIDKWLWAARFYKTRSLAAKAVHGGHVHINGQRAKPARLVQAGDVLIIRRGAVAFEVVIRLAGSRRGPAEQAAALYEEKAESIERREEARQLNRLQRPAETMVSRRPDKRERRKIRTFIRKD